MKLVLASNSPRRKQLLNSFGFDFEVVGSNYQENASDLTPQEMVKTFALGKAKDVFDSLKGQDVLVLGADTVVSLDDKILGKPKDKQQAIEMLKELSGKIHQVWTGYAIISKDGIYTDAVKTDVVFNQLPISLIVDYVATGKPFDKAGAYGIQDGFDLVKEYNGSYNNVVGLPIEEIAPFLKIRLEK